eukprot:COSAG05_NODE_49_length_24373_cov_16.162561_23_plen_50_part_00
MKLQRKGNSGCVAWLVQDGRGAPSNSPTATKLEEHRDASTGDVLVKLSR